MDSDDLKRKLGINDDETYRVNPDTGVVEKQGIFGWKETDAKVEPESGDVQERGIFGWKDTDTRINPESGVVQERNIFGHNDTDTRVNPETGVVQERGVFGWKDSDERIDPETGKHEERGIFGWKNSGSNSRASSNTASINDANSSSEDGLVKLVVGIAVVVFVIWFITSVAIPLVVINLALIALLCGAIKKNWSKVLFPVSIMGAIIVVADYNYGWATHVLVNNVTFFHNWIKPLLYLNLLAGLIAAYLLIRNVLNTRTPPPEGAGELSQRNLIVIGCLLVVGATTIGVQHYVDINVRHSGNVTNGQFQLSPIHNVASESSHPSNLPASQPVSTSHKIDFIHNGITIPDPSNAGNYILAGDWPCSPLTPECRIGPPGKFAIYYISTTDYFNIWIGEPLEQSRKTAQEFLMKTLGITATEMCGLNYSVSTTVYDDYDYAGKELRFSFCPGAASLPSKPSNRNSKPREG